MYGPGNLPLEVQIRTYKMHEEAEYGVAAHWRYKAASRGEQVSNAKHEPGTQTAAMNVGILQAIAEISNSNPESDKFYESLADTLDTDEIVVLTPNGEAIALPSGSTPVDFAYAIHSEVGGPHRRGESKRPSGTASHDAANRGDRGNYDHER